MKNMTKLILLAALFTAPVWSAPEANEKSPAKPALISSQQIDAMDFTKEQTTNANAIMAAHRTEYLAIEKAHLTTLREEENLVKYEIGAFPDKLKKLHESFWREFDEICNDRQKRVARRYMVLKNLFPFGENPVRIEIAHDGNRYSVEQRVTDPPEYVEESQEGSQLDPRWKRFWGDREGTSVSVLESVLFGVRAGERIKDPKALTFEGNQPVLTAGFVDTLNLGPEELVRVNQILLKMRQEYLAVEKKQIGKVKVTEDPDGTKHFVVPPFYSKRKALDNKLWAELGKVLDARQLRLVKQSDGLRAGTSELFDWGNGTYSLAIQDLGVGGGAPNPDERYEITSVMDAGWRGSGSFSRSKKQLPENYRRLLSK